ncbi:MAG: DUF3795 domain-containing protein [Candidatus Odinarchaeota archaeon]|nr:DUF3795 domain-containing protein [Candidatus Odinarchaeota archaeon]
MASFKHCPGCKANDGWGDCPVRKCAEEEGVEICYECNDDALKK